MPPDNERNGQRGIEPVDRVQLSEQNDKAMFGGADTSLIETDPEFVMTMKRFTYGDIYGQGNLSNRQRELISLAVLATLQNEDQLKMHVIAALNAGATPVEIKETMYQCAPYIGFPKTTAALEQVNIALKRQGVSLPVESQTRVAEETRFDKGLEVQKRIFGDIIDQAPTRQRTRSISKIIYRRFVSATSIPEAGWT